MALYGYASVSSLDQDLTLQEEMLCAAGCQIVRAEKKGGTAREGQSEDAGLCRALLRILPDLRFG
jgi:DNA invertase Pin-like site-specific DNA recombinase